MADVKQRKQKNKRKEDEVKAPPPPDEATKEEFKIATWMRQNVPTKKTKFLSHTVEYFTACKAIDELLSSPWSKPPKSGGEALFTTRESVVQYLETMLRHKIFHRARKIVVPESELKPKKKKVDDKDKDGKKEKDGNSKKEEGKAEEANKKEESTAVAESSQAEGDKGDDKKKKKKDEGEKKKRKIRLDMHLQQVFVDGTDAYVWIYTPTPYYYYIFGLLVVLATIAICLFPLWPSSVRLGVYYLSLAAAGFLVFILALAVIRLLVFSMIWGLSLGRHHVWLLPNLTEDVGFFQSFWPLLKYDYKGDVPEDSKNGTSTDSSTAASAKSNQTAGTSVNENEPRNKDGDNSGTESEGSQRSQTGKDFEMVEHEEVDS